MILNSNLPFKMPNNTDVIMCKHGNEASRVSDTQSNIHSLNASADVDIIQAAIEARLTELVPSDKTWPVRLHEAQRHALLSPGKRFRPLLCVLITHGASNDPILRKASIDVGCVAEMVHAASLILDDLPCMDNAALRRNQPTTHLAFDESTAILSATALLNRAFGVLSRLHNIIPETRVALVDLLSYSVGSTGLIAGQMADLANHSPDNNLQDVERLNYLKTGALFEYAIYSAAILTNLSVGQKEELKDFSYHLGLAFQLLDDLKDVQMKEVEAEKSVGRDIGKTTILALLGTKNSKKTLLSYLDSAKSSLQKAGLQNATALDALIERQFAFLNQV
ncbi:geranylgeranyl diphosphate synthase type II [Litorimonas taeanensis]|uniref:Geranylgeranyl diphosphate synthase type II n=1 Tax=Litorimonas taeanensis TaxID=568099 RepID=A0A420WKA3_9PROT|nr:geranylgeranyl diphosphate synthase type II [Litorimonas taeanensis]